MEAEVLKQKFTGIFGDDAHTRIVRAPGRVNLIGEHTDYNDGFVLPVAVDRNLYLCYRANDSMEVKLHSATLGDSGSFDLIEPRTPTERPWLRYPVSVAKVLKEEGWELKGVDGVIVSEIPPGGGLGSSGAFEVAFCLALADASGFELDPVAVAELCQLAESRFAGLECGIMDQFTSLFGAKDMAIFLDCRTLQYELVHFPSEIAKIVVCDTGVRHELASSEYNRRRAECEKAVEMLREFVSGLRSLRDISIATFRTLEANVPLPYRKRARHIISENERVREAVRNLKDKNLYYFGTLMDASHDSLKEDYEVSCRELDVMAEIAQSTAGVYGARMCGGGFGGCVIAVVKPDAVDSFTEKVTSEYIARTSLRPTIHICGIEEGAEVTR